MSQVQIVPLGGVGEIGKNCTAVVQDQDIVVIDCGMSFPNEEQYGVDIVIPDFSYLVENKDRLKGIFLTHAHEDHVGALAYLLPQVKCPVYATEFTAAMVRSKLEERAPGLDVDLKIVSPGDKIDAGKLNCEYIQITHSIPETCSIAVRTVHGIVLFTADFKFDFTPVDGKMTDLHRFADLGEEGVVCLLSDCTNADRKGWSPSESTVRHGLLSTFEEAPGRVLMTMFSSNIHRMQQAMDMAKATGRKVTVAGRRIDQTIQLCSKIGYLDIPEGTFIPIDKMDKYDENEIVVLTTGSQGEPMAALSQMSRQEYTRMQIREGDTILYSARPIPGNEAAIWRTVNALFRMGAHVIYESDDPIHVSGHGHIEELKMMISLTKPYYLAPVHGEERHQRLYQEMAMELGYPDYRVFMIENGSVLTIGEKDAQITGKAPAGVMFIDQQGNVTVTEEMLKDRRQLGHDGVVIVSMSVNLNDGEILKRPKIETKGFSGSPEVLEDALGFLEKDLLKLEDGEMRSQATLETTLVDSVRRTLSRRSRQRPMVIPVVVDTPA
jgi:ribonuclease J